MSLPILTSQIKEFVKTIRLGFVATVCPDGTPNLSPKGTTAVWDEDHLMFADIHSPGTVKNLVTNPSVEINMVDVFTRKGYRFKGRATIVSRENAMFDQMLALYGDAVTQYKIKNMVLVKVERVLEVTSPVYDTGVTEKEIINRYVEYWKSVHSSES